MKKMPFFVFDVGKCWPCHCLGPSVEISSVERVHDGSGRRNRPRHNHGTNDISAHATVEVLTPPGYKVAAQGDNGFVGIVMRGWAGAPTFGPAPVREMIVYSSKVRSRICFDPVASRTILPYHELRAKLAIAGKDPDAIASELATAYTTGKLPKREGVAFAYMWSRIWISVQEPRFVCNSLVFSFYESVRRTGWNSIIKMNGKLHGSMQCNTVQLLGFELSPVGERDKAGSSHARGVDTASL
jgi:hypothetical protein